MNTARTILLCVIASSAVPFVNASAQPGTDVDYSQLIRTALQEFDAGRWADAREHFRQAHELDPGARTLRAIGYTSFELGDYAEAVRTLTLALDEVRSQLTPVQRREVTARLARAEALVGRVELTIAPSDANVAVDGVPGSRLGNVLVLTAGDHQITFSAERYEPETRAVTVQARTTTSLAVTLRASEVAAIPVESPAARARHSRTWRTPAGWSLVGLAGGSMIISLGTGIRGQALHADLEDACPDHVCPPSEAGTIDRGRALVAWSTATTVITVAAGASGAVLLLLDRPSGDETRPPVALTSGPGNVGLGMRASF